MNTLKGVDFPGSFVHDRVFDCNDPYRLRSFFQFRICCELQDDPKAMHGLGNDVPDSMMTGNVCLNGACYALLYRPSVTISLGVHPNTGI